MQSNLFVGNILNGISKGASKLFTNKGKKAGLNWFKIKFLKHLPANKIREFNHKNNNIYYSNPAELLHTLQEIFIKEIYKTDLSNHPFIIDCGANIGLSVIYFKKQNPESEILAFEPDEANFNLLRRNVESFGFNKVSLKKEAVWIKETELDFSNDGNMGSKIQDGSNLNTKKVQAIRLKDKLDRQVDFLKIDIEGAEFEVLKDIKDNLQNVQNMFFEYHGDFNQNKELSEIFKIITDAGFHYYIKEAAEIYERPFIDRKITKPRDYDVQLNIFCFRL